jgi:hypothetical protein
VVGTAAEEAQPRLIQTEIRRTDAVALIERLGGVVEFQVSALDHQHVD